MRDIQTVFKIKDTTVDGAKESPNWIKNGLDQTAIRFAEAFGKWLAGHRDGYRKTNEAMTSTQIRNVFGEIVRIRMQDFDKKNEQIFMMLKPRLTYATERKSLSNPGSRSFRKVIEPAMDAVLDVDASIENRQEEQQKYFDNFANFFEAILAYHKAYDKKI